MLEEKEDLQCNGNLSGDSKPSHEHRGRQIRLSTSTSIASLLIELARSLDQPPQAIFEVPTRQQYTPAAWSTRRDPRPPGLNSSETTDSTPKSTINCPTQPYNTVEAVTATGKRIETRHGRPQRVCDRSAACREQHRDPAVRLLLHHSCILFWCTESFDYCLARPA